MNRKRQIAAAAAVLLSAASVRGLLAEETETCRYIVNTENAGGTGLQGAVYAVYLDEDCTQPLMNAEGEPEEITSGPDGTAELSVLQNSVFLKEIQAPAGYYRNDISLAMKPSEPAVVTNEPVTVLTSLPADCSAVLKDRNTGKTAAEWKDGKWIQDNQQEYVFLSNASYTVKQEDTEWTYYPEQQIVIPDLYDPQISLSISAAEGQPFGKIQVNVPDEDGFSYTVYRDEQAAVPVQDIEGTASAENVIRLQEGTYYLKWTSVPDTYWETSGMEQVTVRNGQMTEVSSSFEVPCAVLHAFSSGDGNEITAGSWYLKDQTTGEAFCVSAGEEGTSVQLKRDRSYYAAFVTERGYYPAEAQLIDVPAEKTDLVLCVQCTPITLAIGTSDEDSGELLEDAEYALYDDTDLLYCWSGSGTITCSQLQPSETYRVTIRSLPQGYLLPSDLQITIPAEDAGTVYAETSAKPFVHWTLEAAENTEASLFTDAECTKKARDIYGSTVENTAEADLFNGTYYAKITSSDEQWYASKDVHEISVSREQGTDSVTKMDLDPVSVKIVVKDEEGTFLTGVDCILQDSKGNTVQTWTSSSEAEVLTGLKRSSVYYLQVKSAPGLYTYSHESIPVSVPMYLPQNIPSAEAVLIPYISFCIYGSDGTSPVGNILYFLYEDEEGQQPVMDIRGNPAEGKSDEEGKVWFNVRKGTYWLKAVCEDDHMTGEDTMRKIVLDGSRWSEEAECLFQTCAFRFLLKDEEGNAVSGAQICLKDDNRVPVYSWITNGTEQYISGDFLYRGMTYCLCIEKVPEGYENPATEVVFSMPSSSKEIQLLQMQISGKAEKAEKKSVSSPSASAETTGKEEESGKQSFLWLAVPLLAAIAVLLRQRKKQNENV